MKKFFKHKRILLLFGSIITFSTVAISSSCSFIQPINKTDGTEKPPVKKPVEKVTPPVAKPGDVTKPDEKPQPPAVAAPKEKGVDDSKPGDVTKPDDKTKKVEPPKVLIKPIALPPNDKPDDKTKNVEEQQPKPGDKTETGTVDPVDKNTQKPSDSGSANIPNNPTTKPKTEIDVPSVTQPIVKKSFESGFDDSEISDKDSNPLNLSGPQKLFSYVVNDYIVKSKLPEVDNKFFNTTLHYINLKGGNNLVWLINSIKNKLLNDGTISQDEIVDGGFNELFKNVSQFNNFSWEIDLSPWSQRSIDFLDSYLGTYFVLSYFSSQKMFNWFDNDVSKEEQDAASMQTPDFLNSDLINFFAASEEFQPELTKLFKIINYWRSKFWISQPSGMKFTIKAVTAGDNYVLQNQIIKTNIKSNSDTGNDDIGSIFNIPGFGDGDADSSLKGKFTVSKDKTPIQNYIDRYIEYKKENGEKFVGLFPVLFRNPDTFNLEKGLVVKKYTLFEWAYEKFILSDRPQLVKNSNIKFKNQVQKDVFVSQVFPKTSKEYTDFANLVNNDGKNIYKNNESYITSEGFDPNSFSDITFDYDWNANFIFAFVKPKTI